jgi:PKHD-type hydroxylase
MLKAYRLLEESVARDVGNELKHDKLWQPGLASSQKATGTTKRNLEIKSHLLLKQIYTDIEKSSIIPDQFIEKVLPPKFNWYKETGEYKIHSDASMMGDIRTDLAMTLFLTDDYEGGELCIDGQQIKAKPGIAIVYDCWRPHWVNPVTKGDRIAAITWLQSYIPDEINREVLNLLHGVTVEVGKQGNQEHFAKLGAVHEKLFKMWKR